MSFFPPEASVMAERVDTLFYALVGVSVLVVAGIGGLIAYFCVRYRAGSPADRSDVVARNRTLEYVWIFTPLVIFLCIFGWAAVLYIQMHRPAPDALEITVVAKQWMWKLQHADGRREINTLHVPLGRPIRLVMISQDVIHSFFVPALRLKQDVLPGRYLSMSFTADLPGTYNLFCAEMCGAGHSNMIGTVYVMTPAAYAQWASSGAPLRSAAQQGERLFVTIGCSGCHGPNASIHAPRLEGLYGRIVHLSGGRSIVADETYIHDSIVEPRKDVVAGFNPIMPSFQGQLDDQQIFELVQYIKSLGPERTAE